MTSLHPDGHGSRPYMEFPPSFLIQDDLSGILAQPVTEAEEQRVALVELESSDVLPRNLHVGHPGELRADSRATAAKWAVGAGARGNPASARVTASIVTSAQDAVLFQMDVNGVLPIAPGIGEYPVFGAVLRYREAEFITVREPVINNPLAIVAVELEVPHDARAPAVGVSASPRSHALR